MYIIQSPLLLGKKGCREEKRMRLEGETFGVSSYAFKKMRFKILMMNTHAFKMQDAVKAPDTSNIKCIIGIYSGKGGVGKTMLASNIAVVLGRSHKVGLLDADIDCPDIANMLGIKDRIKTENGKIIPADKHGIKIVSTAMMQEGDEPLIVRGPMKHNFVMQLIEKTNWGELDYLVIDLPPGTSDVPLSIMEYVRPQMLFVTTSSSAAVMDTKKSIKMAQQIGISVLGVVENMSSEIFGKGAGETLAKETSTEFLGSIDLDKRFPKLSEFQSDLTSDSELAKPFERIADEIRMKTTMK